MGINKGVNPALFNHRSTWDTTKTSVGSSNSDQIKLPLESTGTYNFEVFWGDGTSDVITAWDQAEVTHTYASSGVKKIEIKGQLEGFRFNNTGDRLKLISIENGGNEFRLGENGDYFSSCGNLTSVCINTDEQLNFSNMFKYCYLLTHVSRMNTENAVNFTGMFYNCSIFNQDVSFINSSKATSMESMFRGAYLFNQDMSFLDTSKIETFYMTFRDCSDFNQDISNFSFESVTDVTYMLYSATSWSKANYDAFLISVAGQTVNPGLSFRCSSNYTLGGAAEAARTSLINDDGWTIVDLGGV